jgi:hypothetical protein
VGATAIALLVVAMVISIARSPKGGWSASFNLKNGSFEFKRGEKVVEEERKDEKGQKNPPPRSSVCNFSCS